MTIGIYQIKNTENEWIYIGCSSDIEERWKSHKRNYKNPNSKEYNKILYSDMRIFGIDSFEMSILEECDKEDLLTLEEEYIEETKSFINGYNAQKLERHTKSILSNKDVYNIRTRYSNLERKKDVYKDYKDKISHSGFSKIWIGETWRGILDEVYTDERIEFHSKNTGNSGQTNSMSKLTEEDVINIRVRKNKKEKRKDVYEDYKDKVSFGSFTNTWYGYNWKHIII